MFFTHSHLHPQRSRHSVVTQRSAYATQPTAVWAVSRPVGTAASSMDHSVQNHQQQRMQPGLLQLPPEPLLRIWEQLGSYDRGHYIMHGDAYMHHVCMVMHT